jgi:membrane-bound serine protease (ClpP class)
MSLMGNPNVIYLLLAGGLILAVLALAAPGTGLLELAALAALMLAGFSVYYYSMPINGWAVALILVGLVLFFLALRKARAWPLLLAAILALVLGSAYLFSSGVWYQPAVDPLLAAVVSILSGAFFWVAARKVVEADSARPRHELEDLIGAVGEAKSDIQAEGSVLAAGELWSARSEKLIPTGSRVRVVGREGFILLVERIE